MNLIDKKDLSENFFIEGVEDANQPRPRGLSLTLRKNKSGISMEKAFLLALLLHPIFLAILWGIIQLVLYLFLMFGINIPFIQKPEPKIQDLDFVLETKQREQIIHHTKPVFTEKLQKKFSLSKADNRPLSTPAKQGGGKGNRSMSETVIPLSKNLHKGFRLPKTKEPDVFSIPMPKVKPLSSDVGFGGVGTPGYTSVRSSRKSRISSGEGYKGDGDANVAGKGARKGGDGNGYGSGGNGVPKIGRTSGRYTDILGEPNLNTYITELQRRIKRNWNPPKNNEDKTVVLFLRIAKDGRVLILNVKSTSENADIDNAAISAVKKTQPFRPLPSGYKSNYVDAVFTFDYNINSVGAKF